MNIKNHKVKRSNLFISDFKQALTYISDNLQNPIAAENLLNLVEKNIGKICHSPHIFPKYKSQKRIYHKVQVKNYILFYVIQKDLIILSRFLYTKRNFKNLI